MIATLPRPTEQAGDFWVDEAIWGHRLYDEQTPWLTVLEFLGVLRAEAAANRALIELTPNSLSYRPQQQLRLRNVVFNDPHLGLIAAERLPDDLAWSKWCELMSKHAAGLRVDEADFAYLKTRFQTFQDFAAVVGFLRSTAIEGASNKRWSSKFVFPFGPAALYEDLNVGENSVTNDRRFFGRTGELLYLMLSRTSHAKALAEQLSRRFLDEESSLGRLIRAIQGPDQVAPNERGGAYLPHQALPEYGAMAADWLALMRRSLPNYDVLPHIVTITGLHLILYQIKRARAVLGAQGAPEMVLEIVSPRRTVLRELSATSYDENNVLPRQAIEAFIRAVVETEEWKLALASGDPRSEAVAVLRRNFEWPDKDDEEARNLEPNQLVEALIRRARDRHMQHLGKVHTAWGRSIGLSSRRASRKVRYAPTDSLLKTLVICSVEKRVPFKEFLELLHERYGFVIGDAHAARYISSGQADQDAFSDNARRLEERLASLGLVTRLSDSCAYVENPFAGEDARATG